MKIELKVEENKLVIEIEMGKLGCFIGIGILTIITTIVLTAFGVLAF
jgi:hypothetical protein